MLFGSIIFLVALGQARLFCLIIDIQCYTMYILNALANLEVDPMAEKKKRKKLKKKDSQLLIRINGEEREQFIDLCEQLDSSAAREIRRFIRDFIAEQETNLDE